MPSTVYPRRRESLFEKTLGPNAVSVEELVERGNASAQRARAAYPDFLRARIPVVVALAKALFADSPGRKGWRTFYTAMHDLRSSSASAGHNTISAICQSLETLLMERDPSDVRMPRIIELHLDALKLAAADKMTDGEESALLIADLARAVKRLASV